MIKIQNYIVITGGPGVGKTTLINALKLRGKRTIQEDARQVIRQQMEVNGEGLPWKNKSLYAKLMLEASLNTYQTVTSKATNETIYFDRGILDTICYMQMENLPISKELLDIVHSHPYNQKVFILPPWLDIYETDDERKQTWKEALFTFDQMKQTYISFGYQVIEVSKETTEKRCEFILDNL